MTFAEYAQKAHQSANHTINPAEILVGLVSEHGEVLEEIKRMIRNGGNLTDKVKHGTKIECGDTLWYMSEAATLAGHSLAFLDSYAWSTAKVFMTWPNVSPLMAALKMVAISGEIAELLADTILMGRQLKDNGSYEKLAHLLINSLAWMHVLLDSIGVTIEEVMEANLEKLAHRNALKECPDIESKTFMLEVFGSHPDYHGTADYATVTINTDTIAKIKSLAAQIPGLGAQRIQLFHDGIDLMVDGEEDNTLTFSDGSPDLPMLNVSADGFFWSGYYKHTDGYRWHTLTVPLAALNTPGIYDFRTL